MRSPAAARSAPRRPRPSSSTPAWVIAASAARPATTRAALRPDPPAAPVAAGPRRHGSASPAAARAAPACAPAMRRGRRADALQSACDTGSPVPIGAATGAPDARPRGGRAPDAPAGGVAAAPESPDAGGSDPRVGPDVVAAGGHRGMPSAGGGAARRRAAASSAAAPVSSRRAWSRLPAAGSHDPGAYWCCSSAQAASASGSRAFVASSRVGEAREVVRRRGLQVAELVERRHLRVEALVRRAAHRDDLGQHAALRRLVLGDVVVELLAQREPAQHLPARRVERRGELRHRRVAEVRPRRGQLLLRAADGVVDVEQRLAAAVVEVVGGDVGELAGLGRRRLRRCLLHGLPPTPTHQEVAPDPDHRHAPDDHPADADAPTAARRRPARPQPVGQPDRRARPVVRPPTAARRPCPRSRRWSAGSAGSSARTRRGRRDPVVATASSTSVRPSWDSCAVRSAHASVCAPSNERT